MNMFTRNPEVHGQRMMIKPKFWQTVSIATVLVALTDPVLACTMVPPPTEIPPIWIKNTGDSNGQVTGSIALQLNLIPGVNGATADPPDPNNPSGLFDPSDITECACGISFLEGLPSSLNITDAKVGLGDKTDIVNTFMELEDANGDPIFGFERNSGLDMPLADGTLNPDGITSPLSSDPDNWVAFSDSEVPDFNPDADFPLTPEKPFYFLVFDFEIAPGELPLLNTAPLQFAAGTPNDPAHPISYTGQGISAEQIPEHTSSLGLLALGALGVGSALKRKLKPSNSSEILSLIFKE